MGEEMTRKEHEVTRRVGIKMPGVFFADLSNEMQDSQNCYYQYKIRKEMDLNCYEKLVLSLAYYQEGLTTIL